MRINLRKTKLLLQKTFFLYIILILLGLNSYVGETFAAETPLNQSHFDSTLTFSLSIESTSLPVLWSRQIVPPISIPEPESASTPFPNIPTFGPVPTLTPDSSPDPTPEAKNLLSILNQNQETLNNISWGTLVPNGEYNTTLILNNKGTDPLNVTMRTENWQSIAAKSFITTSLYQNLTKVDSQGILIQPLEKVELKLLLTISPLIKGINEFEMDFIFTATNMETDDLSEEITIASNPCSLSTLNPTPMLTPSPSPSPVLNQSNVILLSIFDENEESLDEILWGSLVPDGEYNKTLILNNNGINPLNVTMRVENWKPLEAESFILTSLYQNLSEVNLNGVLIGPSEKVELKLLLKISPLIEEINEFEMDFIFTATNKETDDLPEEITIASNP